MNSSLGLTCSRREASGNTCGAAESAADLLAVRSNALKHRWGCRRARAPARLCPLAVTGTGADCRVAAGPGDVSRHCQLGKPADTSELQHSTAAFCTSPHCLETAGPSGRQGPPGPAAPCEEARCPSTAQPAAAQALCCNHLRLRRSPALGKHRPQRVPRHPLCLPQGGVLPPPPAPHIRLRQMVINIHTHLQQGRCAGSAQAVERQSQIGRQLAGPSKDPAAGGRQQSRQQRQGRRGSMRQWAAAVRQQAQQGQEPEGGARTG